MIPRELEGDSPYYQSVKKKMDNEMVRDMGLVKVWLPIKDNSIWFRGIIIQRRFKRKTQTTTYWVLNICHSLYCAYNIYGLI